MSPCTRIENTTTQYVSASTVFRNGPTGNESASATDMPPRNPPQVNTFHEPGGNLNAPLNSVTGAPTVKSRATSVATIASNPANGI